MTAVPTEPDEPHAQMWLMSTWQHDCPTAWEFTDVAPGWLRVVLDVPKCPYCGEGDPA